jgi:integrase
MSQNGRIPKYRLHKTSGRAVVTLDGRDVYLGKYGTEASKANYDRLIREWLENGRHLPCVRAETGPTMAEIILRYWTFAQGYYRKDGRPTGEVACIRSALRPVRRLYGDRPAREFGPLALKACRDELVREGSVRQSVNAHVGRIKRMIAWAVENEVLEGNQLHALQAVKGLRRGRCEAPEGRKVRPVADEDVDAVLLFLPAPVQSMVQLQRWTGMRPGEVVIMRACDIDRSVTPWRYTPESHKTEHHGHRRTVLLGPKARGVLTKCLVGRQPEEYLFSPTEAEEARNAKRKIQRRSPMTPSQRARRRKSNRKCPWRERYDADSYRRAITRACEKAKVPVWTPHRLRHAAATEIRRRDGIETARTVLGHACVQVTEIYAERDLARAARIVEQVG